MQFRKRAIFLVVISLIAVSCSISAFAQGGSATISGRITDAGGLAVAGAKVQAMHVETATTATAESNEAGFYNIPNLVPGTYKLVVEKEGFEQVVSTGLALHATDNVSMAFALKVGTVSQTVTVEGTAPVVNTTTSSLGGLVNDEKIADLPLNGRNFIDLSLLQPGVTQNYNQGSGGGAAGTWFSSNGAPVRSNYVTIDGASMITQLGGSAGSQSGNTLGVDGIKEYVVLTHNYSAEYGMTMGSQMIIVSKGGTNQFHGTAFEYLRNSDLDAKNHFDTASSAGLTAAGAQRRLPPFQRNNFGGSFGGPIRKDKTFVFANFEGLRQKLGFTATDIVPAGNCHGPAGAVITNVQCTQLGSTASVTIAAVMAPILALYPFNPANMNSSSYSAPTTNYTTDNFGQIRIDQNFSDKDSFFGRYTIEDGLLNNGSGNISTLPTGTAFPQYVSLVEPNRNQFLTLSENHILSPTLLNTARLSYSRTKYNVHANAAAVLTGPNVSFVAGNPIGSMQVGGLTNLGVGLGSGPNPDNIHVQNVYTLSDDVFFTHGKNSFKFGTLINRFNQGMAAAQAPDGQIQFNGLATMLTGAFSNYNSQTQGLDTEFDFIYNTFGFYVQDDYRATSRLTFNLGLRYEFNTTPNELNGFQAGIRNMKTDTALTPGPVIDDKSYVNFSPRLGFAYDVFGNGKTAVRGGFGILYDVGNIGNLLYQGVISMPPIAAQATLNNTANAILGAQAGGNGTPLFTYPPGTASNNLHMDIYHEGQPHVYQFNLTVEQQLPFGIGMSVAYVGSRGSNLLRAEEGNPYTPTSFVNGVPVWGNVYNCTTPNQFFSSYAVTGGNCTSNAGTGPTQYQRLNPNWSSAILIATGALSWYDSLQVVLNKRLGHGLEFQSAYTWAHNLDTTNGQGYSSDCGGTDMANADNPFNPNVFDKGQACSDIRQNWRFNVLYYFPKVQSDGIVSKFVNGWWTGSIVSIQTGYPFSAGENTNRAQSGLFTGQVISERANINTAASLAANPCTSPCLPYTPIPFDPKTVYTGNPNQWVNPAMFSLQPIGTLGNSARGLLHGPDLGQWNLTIAKDTAVGFLGEKGSVEFRADVFNALNHTNYGSPNGAIFTGGLTAASAGPYSEAPVATAGKITTTATTSRQMQFSLRLIF